MKYAIAIVVLLALAGCRSSGCDDCSPASGYPEPARWWK